MDHSKTPNPNIETLAQRNELQDAARSLAQPNLLRSIDMSSPEAKTAAMPESLDALLAQLSLQQQVIDQQRQQLDNKTLEVSQLRESTNSTSYDDDQLSGLYPSDPSVGIIGQPSLKINTCFASRDKAVQAPSFAHTLEGRESKNPKSGDDSFINQQIAKHTFAQAVDPDFYDHDINSYSASMGQSQDLRIIEKQQLPRPDISRSQSWHNSSVSSQNFYAYPAGGGMGYNGVGGSNIWNNSNSLLKDASFNEDLQTQSPASGKSIQPYWHSPVGHGLHARAYSLQEKPNNDWKMADVGKHRRGLSASSPMDSILHSSAPNPLSPTFLHHQSHPSWETDGNMTQDLATGFMPYSSGGYSEYTCRDEAGLKSPVSITSNTWGINGTSLSGPQTPVSTYVTPAEPLNYRRLLERSVNCDWRYIVEKVVSNNDQQASIFLQQKLKVGNNEQRLSIVDAIVEQAYPLMTNRFGNFLVQRCYEHGEQYHIDAITNAIRGHVLQLSMDAFGCHVIQKTFDCVDEAFRLVMVQELLRQIPETVSHKFACHVWQKLFELRWTETPPQIMQHVNKALIGMWSEVALGETGSLVVQNIFENCLEEDKRPCINEVLANIDIIAHGQYGNWCIQHICEHGAPMDRNVALDHVLRSATEYSMDQFASKVVEKCLKVAGEDFLDRYLDRVCEGRSGRPRIPLIDIASDQYGNYLVQHILQTAAPHHREVVASHIRKHMVSLRGSKFGSRVGMLCVNNNYMHRPVTGNIQSSGQRYGNQRWGYR